MKAARRALVAERCPGSPDSFTCYRRRTLRTHVRSLLLVLGGLFLLNGPQVATNAAAATVAMTFHVAQGGATQPAEPWWSQWGPTDSDNACAATVAIDGYIHTMTGLAADGTISGGTTFASGRPPSALTASIDALQHPPMGGSHQATFWETTIARATTDEAIAYIWEASGCRRSPRGDGRLLAGGCAGTAGAAQSRAACHPPARRRCSASADGRPSSGSGGRACADRDCSGLNRAARTSYPGGGPGRHRAAGGRSADGSEPWI